MATFDMKELARLGAAARLQELSEEMDAIHRAFPDLRSKRRGRRPGSARDTSAEAAPTGKRKRRKMSAAQRKAVGLRMTKYWAARRAAQGTKKR